MVYSRFSWKACNFINNNKSYVKAYHEAVAITATCLLLSQKISRFAQIFCINRNVITLLKDFSMLFPQEYQPPGTALLIGKCLSLMEVRGRVARKRRDEIEKSKTLAYQSFQIKLLRKLKVNRILLHWKNELEMIRTDYVKKLVALDRFSEKTSVFSFVV